MKKTKKQSLLDIVDQVKQKLDERDIDYVFGTGGYLFGRRFEIDAKGDIGFVEEQL